MRVLGDRAEHLHILDLDRGTLTQIMFEGQLQRPAGVVEGRRSDRVRRGDRSGKGLEMFLSRSDGTGEQRCSRAGSGTTRVPSSFSPDGRLLAFMEINPKTNMDIMVLSLADNTVTPFLNSPNVELLGNFSPDGKWMAYQVVDPSGRPEVFVRSYPDGGALRQVSNGGGVFRTGRSRGGRSSIWAASRSWPWMSHRKAMR